MHTITINASTTYEVHIGENLLDQSGALAARCLAPCHAMLISDDTVFARYGQRCTSSFEKSGFQVSHFTFPAGESSKNILTLSDILESMADAHITRSDVVIALGGGVVGDIAGFAAAIFNRGMPFIQIPTTLLAAVDSSVGGKTAIDLKGGKNLAGAFHQPALVITDTAIIRDLPAEQLACGAAEVIKYGVLSDPTLFEIMESGQWLDHLDEVICRSVSNKRNAVAADEFDRGTRQMLNLGHTFGHAVEKCSNLQISHGQGVAIGMVMAADAANLDADLRNRLVQCLLKNGLPVSCDFTADALLSAALSDKKRSGNMLTLVLPKSIGQCVLQKVPIDQLPEYFKRALKGQEARPL